MFLSVKIVSKVADDELSVFYDQWSLAHFRAFSVAS
jgi:hypothetical protein